MQVIKNIAAISVLIVAIQFAKGQAYHPDIKISYVRTWDALAPETNGANLVNRPLKDARQTTQYVDGLGRPLQLVVKSGALTTGSSPVDLVTPMAYDKLGREERKYMGYAAPTTDGSFKYDPFAEQQNFCNSLLAGQNESHFYAKTDFEASPLNRTAKTYAPGSSWVQAGRGVEAHYWHNTITDDVKKWEVTDVANNFGSYVVNGTYAVGELFKTISVDEHGKQVIEFKDKDGMLLLKKVQFSAPGDNGSGSGYTGWLCTYYLYDKLAQLRCVVQPKAVEELAKPAVNWQFNADILNELCFRYEYDTRSRMIVKKVPGAGEVYMVYDSRDRLMLQQDANMRTNQQWIYTKYDALNRPVVTGFYTSSLTQGQMADAVATSGLALCETRNSSSFVGYTLTQSFPASSSADVLTITYYDDYGYTGWFGSQYNAKDNSFDNLFTAPASMYPEPLTQSSNTKGLPTGKWIKVLGTSTGMVTVNFYDAKGRVIQAKTSNITGGTDILTTQYDFSGKVLQTVLYQDKQGTNAQTQTVQTKMEYDDLGRMIDIKKKVTTSLFTQSNLDFKSIASLKYDALGQLKEKRLSPGFNGTELEKLLVDYNIRGWMLGINRDYAKSNATDRKFGFDLGYDKQSIQSSTSGTIGSYTTALYNGNITGTVWKSAGDQEIRRYDFTYDAINRLTTANFTQYTGSTFNTSAGIDFSVSNLTYDANGNIKTMQQQGWKITGSATIDNLQYNYKANELSNQLLNVIDASGNTTNVGDFRTSPNHPAQSKTNSTIDYEYDANGNMVKDLNKDLANLNAGGITYNHLNLPATITVKPTSGIDKGTIQYVYDAAGNKLRKVVSDKTVNGKTITTTTTYILGLVYESRITTPTDSDKPDYTDVLQFIGHEEGRIRFEKATTATCPAQPDRFIYDYFLKDHLGNVRMVLTEQSELLCYPMATVEDATVNTEDDYYNIQSARITPISTTGASDASFGQKLYRVNGSTSQNERTGMGIVLKVMAGDQVTIRAESFYKIPGGGMGSTNNLAVTDLLQSLIGSSGFPTSKGLTVADISNIAVNTSALTAFINNNSAGSGKPKAFLNWILFDDRMEYHSSGADPVGDDNTKKVHDVFLNSPVVIAKSGYIYIYVSNETDMNVYFDNLSVSHVPGPILEETHYYPFGLSMVGVSSKAASGIDNKFEITEKEKQDKEFGDGSGLNWHDFGARMYDLQIGKFHQIDPHAPRYYSWTPYNYVGNSPVNIVDLDGKDWFQDKHGNIIWNNSREKGITVNSVEYKNIGTSLVFNVDSYISEGNDIGIPLGAGSKLANLFTITGKYDKEGNFIGFSVNLERTNGKTFGLFEGTDGVDGQPNQDAYLKQLSDGSYVGGFEQHSTTALGLTLGMKVLHGRNVDVTQDFRVTIGKDGKFMAYIMHGTYPSVEITVNGSEQYRFVEHSFLLSHSKTTEKSNIRFDLNKTMRGILSQSVSDKLNLINRSKQAPYIVFGGFNSEPVNVKNYSKISW